MSTIDRLPVELRELIGRLRQDGRTIDEILAKLQELDANVSRSALGRHVKDIEAVGKEMRQQNAMAEAIMKSFGQEVDNRLLRSTIQMLLTLGSKALTAQISGAATINAEEGMLFATMIQRLASASKSDTDRQLATRKAVVKEVEGKVEELAKSEGLTADTVAKFRAAILGVAA